MLRALAVLAMALLLGCSSGGGGGSGGGGASSGGASRPPSATLLAGAAAVDITPRNGAPLAGFGSPPRREFTIQTIPALLSAIAGNCYDPDPSDAASFFVPAQGVRDPIMARALVLANGVRKTAIVKLDTIGASRQLREDIAQAAALLGIAPKDLVVCGTHTHSGPGAVTEQRLWQIVAADCFHAGTYQAMLAGAIDALRRADAALRPAELGIGAMHEANASRNRRGRPGIYDTELGLVKVIEQGSGAPIAALFNFAVHGTCLGASSMVFSADCMGEMERVVEAGLGGGIAIFTNGAEGDVAPAHGGPSGIQLVGGLVGNDVLALWPNVATKPWVELRGSFEDVAMPPPTFNTGCFPIPGTSDTICDFIPGFSLSIPLVPGWVSTVLPFQAIRIDDTVFATIPGEAITEIGWDVKARGFAKGFARAFVIGLANDHGAYFTTYAEYVRGEYEGMATLYGPTTGDVVVGSADRVMDAVR